MKGKIIYIVTFFYVINIIYCQNNKTDIDYSNYINWGKENEIDISPLIEIQKDKGIIHFVAKEDIKEKQELLFIPHGILFTVEKILNLLNVKELKAQYESFMNLNINTYEPNHINLQKEEIFLSYILYLLQHDTEFYKNTKFYEIYNIYIKSLEKYMPKSPLFFSTEQIEYLSGTYLGKFHEKIKKLFMEEISIFKNESYYNKSLDYKDYVHNRLCIHNKGIEVKEHFNMIPFLDIFDRDYMKFNAKLDVERNGDIKIVAKKFIKKDEIIIVNSPKRTNVERYIFEGELNYYLVNYKEKYIIPAFSPGLYYKYDIDDIELYNTLFINVAEDKFELKALDIYKNYTELFKNEIKNKGGENGDRWAYEILLENINFYKEYVDSFNNEKINGIFDDAIDRINIDRVMKGESKLLQKCSRHIQHKIDKMKKEEENKKKNTDL